MRRAGVRDEGTGICVPLFSESRPGMIQNASAMHKQKANREIAKGRNAERPMSLARAPGKLFRFAFSPFLVFAIDFERSRFHTSDPGRLIPDG